METRFVNGLLKLLSVAGVVFVGLGCEEKQPNAQDEQAGQREEPSERGEQSPNARILPEPLESGPAFREDDRGGPSDEEQTAVERWGQPRPFPVHEPVARDTLKRGVGAGFEMQFQVAWPEAKRSVTVAGETREIWPILRVQLLRALMSQPARMRWTLEGPAFLLPEGTEIRARSDRIGHLVLWPNGRDYRVAPPGSLHALLADRRVDRVPFVEHQKVSVGQGLRLGKPTKKHSMQTSVGRVEMDFVPVKELPYASELLCSALLEIVRVRANEELCPRAHLPVHFAATWPNENKVVFTVVSWGAVASLDSADFLIPPEMPVFKRGELPPFDEFVFDAKARRALLPLAEQPGPPVDPVPPAPGPAGQPRSPSAPQQPGPPRNQVIISNELNRPLVVILDQLPVFWLLPGGAKKFYLSSPEIRVGARDFLGEIVLVERKVSPPAELRLGVEAEQETPPSGVAVP